MEESDTLGYNFVQYQEPVCQFPCIFKVGHAHGGLGKVKVETETAFQVGKELKLYVLEIPFVPYN